MKLMQALRRPKRYATMTRQERIRAIASTRNPSKLAVMWRAWEAQGQSREGLLYAAVLERRAELGEHLTPDENALIRRVYERREHGRKLPPIRGQFNH